MEPVKIRPYNPDTDEGFIYSSWIQSYWDSDKVRGIPWSLYNQGQHQRIDQLLKTSTVLTACQDEDIDQILGYIVAWEKPFTIHWLYVKAPFRKFGIGRKLINQFDLRGPKFYTHDVKVAQAIQKKIGAAYNPYLIG